MELMPRYDSRGSFGGKAKVRVEDGKTILTSYTTDVAYIKDGKAYVNGLYSGTTTRHIKEFLLQNGFKAENSRQILKDYGKAYQKEKKKEVKKEAKEKKVKWVDDGTNPLRDRSDFNMVGMAMAMGDVFGQNQKEKNAWKLRMAKAGFGNQGLDIPEDWDTLSEDEKARRLKGVEGIMKEK
jgi:hypothetical protein